MQDVSDLVHSLIAIRSAKSLWSYTSMPSPELLNTRRWDGSHRAPSPLAGTTPATTRSSLSIPARHSSHGHLPSASPKVAALLSARSDRLASTRSSSTTGTSTSKVLRRDAASTMRLLRSTRTRGSNPLARAAAAVATALARMTIAAAAAAMIAARATARRTHDIRQESFLER